MCLIFQQQMADNHLGNNFMPFCQFMSFWPRLNFHIGQRSDFFLDNWIFFNNFAYCSFGYTTIFINVLDANDNAPVFDRSHYDVVLKHLDNPSDPILSVSAIDYDTGDNARITYRISNDQHKQFRIDQNNGTVFLQVILFFWIPENLLTAFQKEFFYSVLS